MKTRDVQFLFGSVFALAIAFSLFALPLPVSSAPTSVYSVTVSTTTDEFGGGADVLCGKPSTR
jgi:hypothetical protein